MLDTGLRPTTTTTLELPPPASVPSHRPQFAKGEDVVFTKAKQVFVKAGSDLSPVSTADTDVPVMTARDGSYLVFATKMFPRLPEDHKLYNRAHPNWVKATLVY